MFPIEIWEQILKNIDDPIELTRLRRVSKAWNNIVTPLLQCTDAWYAICKRDIHEHSMCLIFKHQNIPGVDWKDFDASKDRLDLWAGLYRSWMDWRRLPVRSCTVKALAPFAEDTSLEFITGVAALSDTIAVGTSKGRMIAYNIVGEKKHTTKIHRSSIRDVTLWRNYVGNVMVSTSTDTGVVNHFDLNKKKSEGSNGRGTLLSSSFQCCYSLRKNTVTIFEPVPVSNESVYSLQDHTLSSSLGKNVATMYATRDRLYLWDKNGQIITCRRESRSRMSKEMNIPDEFLFYVSQIPMPKISIRSSYKIFSPIVFCCVGELGQFGFSVTGSQWKMYDEFPKLFAPVTSILFHIGVLALGLNTGEIYLYRIDDANQLENMDFKKMIPKKLRLDTMAIRSLNAAEHNSTHYLIAATKRQVYIVEF